MPFSWSKFETTCFPNWINFVFLFPPWVTTHPPFRLQRELHPTGWRERVWGRSRAQQGSAKWNPKNGETARGVQPLLWARTLGSTQDSWAVWVKIQTFQKCVWTPRVCSGNAVFSVVPRQVASEEQVHSFCCLMPNFSKSLKDFFLFFDCYLCSYY